MTVDLSWITKRVSTGGSLTSAADVDELVAAGVTHVIDLRDDFDDHSLLAAHPELLVLWNGTPDDGQAKSDDWFFKSIAFGLSGLSYTGTKVHCHCAAGINRGPSTAYLLLRAHGLDPAFVLAAVKAGRPQAAVGYSAQADSFLERIVFGLHHS